MIPLHQYALFVVVLLTLEFAAFGQATNNPINGSAPIAPWSLVLEEVFRLPNTDDGIARPEILVGNSTNGLNYVIDQHGPIYSFDPNAANPTPTLFLDLDTVLGNLHDGGESGVRGLAFHPDFGNEGTPGHRKMYTTISRNSSAAAVGSPVVFDSPSEINHWAILGEWSVNLDDTVNLVSYRELMRIEQPFGNHNSGHIGFNTAAVEDDDDFGKLYIVVGDGGSGGGPFDLSQDIDTTPAPYPHGKILRIDPIASASDPYQIPDDNPFFGQANRVQEVWAYGLRNPHKFSFDSETGQMYVSDIGQGTVEEINVGRSRANYGWNEREGAFVYVDGNNVSPLPPEHASDEFTYPVAQYDHNGTNGTSTSGTAIVGGPVYRGDDVPELDGIYLFADFSNNPGPIFAVHVDDLVERDDFTNIANLDDGRLSPFMEVKIRDDGVDKDFRQFLRDANNSNYGRTDTRWGEGADGEVYMMSKRDGRVRRIVSVVAESLVLGDMDCNGDVDFDDIALFVLALTDPGGYEAIIGVPAELKGDIDTDGDLDFDDIGGFVAILTSVDTAGIQTVPEPGTAVLLCLGVGVFALRQWQRRATKKRAKSRAADWIRTSMIPLTRRMPF